MNNLVLEALSRLVIVKWKTLPINYANTHSSAHKMRVTSRDYQMMK